AHGEGGGGDLRRGRRAPAHGADGRVGLRASQMLARDNAGEGVSYAHAATSRSAVGAPAAAGRSRKKFASRSLPCSVRMLSGWNWTPWTGYSRCRMAMMTPLLDLAVTSSAGGTASGAAHSE